MQVNIPITIVLVCYSVFMLVVSLYLMRKVKKAVDKLKDVLNPYFMGKLNEIDVVKVVVTTNAESAKDCELMYELDAAAAEENEEG